MNNRKNVENFNRIFGTTDHLCDHDHAVLSNRQNSQGM